MRMDQLPQELVEEILKDNILDFKDLVNVSSTCRRLRNSVMNNIPLWKEICHKRHPEFAKIVDDTRRCFFEQVQHFYVLKKKIFSVLETMPKRIYSNFELSLDDLEKWNQLLGEEMDSYSYVITILEEIIDKKSPIDSRDVVPLNTPGNLTLKYYAKEALQFFKVKYLKKTCLDFLRLPPEKQVLEKGIVLIAQWFQPEIRQEDIGEHLDCIYNIVKEKLRRKNENHPIFSRPKENFNKWKNENLDRNQWSFLDSRQIISAISEVMFTDLEFSEDEDCFAADANYINKVVVTKLGSPILLQIIFESVARRFGVLLDPILMHGSFLLRFTQNEEFYEVALSDGGVLTKAHPQCSPSICGKRARGLQIFQHISDDFQNEAIWYSLDCGNHHPFIISLMFFKEVFKSYFRTNQSSDSFLQRYVKTKNSEDRRTKPLPPRPQQLGKVESSELDKVHERQGRRFGVGMVVRHVDNGQKGVIYGWSRKGPNWSFSKFYHILTETGSYQIFQQEDLVKCSEVGEILNHPDLGRYFSHFIEDHFVPNVEMEKWHPEDRFVRSSEYYLKIRNKDLD